MRRWLYLKDLQKRGLIHDLERQVWYDLQANGLHICDYVADFVYRKRPGGERIVEDFKGVLTDVFRIKAKLFRSFYGFDIKIVHEPTEDP